MTKNNAELAEAYYKAMGEKNTKELAKYLHPDVQFIGPLSVTRGKAAFLEAIEKFTSFFKSLTIRYKFGEGDHAMVIYDVDFPAPIGILRTSALLTIQEGLITKIELFFDARPFGNL